MGKMGNDYSVLLDDDIVRLMIEGEQAGSPLPYLSKADIESLGAKFSVYHKSQDSIEENITRKKLTKDIINKSIEKGNTAKLLHYLVSEYHLKKAIGEKMKLSPFGGDVGETRSEIENEFIDKINEQLLYSNQRIYSDGQQLLLVDGDKIPEVRVHNEINIVYVKELLSRVQTDLDSGDYDSVITKARTMLEEVFLFILRENSVQTEFKGNIKKMRGQVNAVLGMKPQKDWNPRIKPFIGHVNAIVDSIIEMRNKDSDAHASAERIKLSDSEIELLINTTINVGVYYLKVNQRRGKK